MRKMRSEVWSRTLIEAFFAPCNSMLDPRDNRVKSGVSNTGE